jgi:hypothetical protein
MALSVLSLVEPEQQEPQFFDFPEPECIRIRIQPKMEYKKVKNWRSSFWGNNAASKIENARF